MRPDPPRFAAIEAFRDLTEAQRIELEQRLELVPVERGEVLVREWDIAEALFLVVSGRFEVLVAGRSQSIAEIGVGTPIGEIAFFAGGLRTATVKALRDSLVLRLLKTDFEDLVSQYPQIWTSIASTLAQRLAATTSGARRDVAPGPRTITLCAAGAEALDMAVVRNLREVFGAHAKIAVLDHDSWQRGRTGGAARAEATPDIAYFNEMEVAHDFVFYIADAEATEWSRKAVRQADIVLSIGRQNANTSAKARQPNAVEQFAFSLHKPESLRLALVHDRTGSADHTRDWLSVRPPMGMHHHLGFDHPPDFERLYRFISGKASGLVACGGGAFAAAHIGLYQAFEEMGLAFDILGGTSGGAAMTAAIALGASPDEIERRTHDIFVTRKALRRWTVPRYSLLDHTEFDRALQEYFGDVQIEDLWKPFFAQSTNLTRNVPHLHQGGALWRAVRASCSIPALLPPVYTADGEMLVDGCISDNVPLKAMHAVKTGPNVVVDFKVPELARDARGDVALPGRRELLWASMTRARRQRLPAFPSPQAVLLRSLMLNRSNVRKLLDPDDLLMEVPIPPDMTHLDWHRHGELRKLAYGYAKERLQPHEAAEHPIFGAASSV